LPKNPVGQAIREDTGRVAIRTEKLGWLRPGWTKYLMPGPWPPITVEMKIVPGTPV
jgi:hypothetical protein